MNFFCVSLLDSSTRMTNLRTLYNEALQYRHSERSEKSHAETLRSAQGDTRGCSSRTAWFSL